MAKFRWLILLLAAALVAGGVLAGACGGDDDDDDNDDNDTADDDTTDDDTTDDDTTDDDTTDDDDDLGTFGGTVVDYLTENPQEGAQVELLDNTTGDPFDPPLVAFSDASGLVSFNNIPAGVEQVGVKVDLADYMTTIQYYFNVGTTDATILAVSNNTVNLIALTLGVTLDDTKGQIAGAVYWIPAAADREDVGCAVVTTDPTNDNIFYFGDLLPNPDYTHTNPANAAFAALNAEPGAVTITATVDASSEQNVLPQVYANSISITSVYFLEADYPANPTPGGCTAGK